MYKSIIIFIICFSISNAYGQFQVQYLHSNPLKFSLNDLNKIKIISKSAKSSVRVHYSIIDMKKNKVVDVNFKLVDLLDGVNSIDYHLGDIIWYNSPYREPLQKDRLVSGSYQLCVQVSDFYEVLPEVDECFDIELQPIDIVSDLNNEPIELKSPGHKDTIEEQRPLLTWNPPAPIFQNTEYQVILVEKNANQTCTEAINNNIPLISKTGITTNNLGYPSESPSLKKGSTYCWRALAYKDLKEYSRSEDWQFKVKLINIEDSGIPLISSMSGSNINFRGNSLKFGIDNFSNIDFVLIKIKDMNLEDVIHKIKINYGYNIIELNNEDFVIGKKYLIQCENVNGNNYSFYATKFEK